MNATVQNTHIIVAHDIQNEEKYKKPTTKFKN